MYHVELLPTSTTHLTPGWTYVPDRGFDPAQAAIAPAIGRKRGIRDAGGRGDISSRENNAIIRHLAELDRENHRDVQIAIPVKQKDAAGRGTRGKVTPNVRRILQSQKTFRNHLDDEEAHLSLAAQTSTTTGGGGSGSGSGGHHTAQRPSTSSRISKPAQRRSSTPAQPPKAQQHQRKAQTPAPPSTTEPQNPAELPTEARQQSAQEDKNQLIRSDPDSNPLLRSHMPPTPSSRLMQALLSEPPLPYNGSRAGPPITKKPGRAFCCICGYWGKIRCKGCHVRTCGLGCYKVHEESRCGAFM